MFFIRFQERSRCCNLSKPVITSGIKDHPEFGQTLTRADGNFDMAVNGGGLLTIKYDLPGFCPGQRKLIVPWQGFAIADDIALVALDDKANPVDLVNATEPIVAQGNPVTDDDGTRQASMIFPMGTEASMVMPDGSIQPLPSMTVRATEFTVGENGEMAMPAPLPPTSGYTYAVEFSVDEAIAAGAESVEFSKPVPSYVENFLGFPAGIDVPSAYFDPKKGTWIPTKSGLVIDIISITNSMVDLDVDGSGNAANATALTDIGIDDEERIKLATLYTAGQSIWRVPINHFSAYDWNWSQTKGPADSIGPRNPKPVPAKPQPDDSCKLPGSIIHAESQALGEVIPVTGTPFNLHYLSSRVPGYGGFTNLDIPLIQNVVPASLIQIELSISVAGRLFEFTFEKDKGEVSPNQKFNFSFDGLDVYGRPVTGTAEAVISINYLYPAQYVVTRQFGEAQSENVIGSGRTVATRPQSYRVTLSRRDFAPLGLGGWTLNAHHVYDPMDKTLYLGEGSQRSAQSITKVVTTAAGGGDPDFTRFFNGLPATDFDINDMLNVTTNEEGIIFFSNDSAIFRVEPDGSLNVIAGKPDDRDHEGIGGPAIRAKLYEPTGLEFDSVGNLYFLDNYKNQLLQIDTDGILNYIAGKEEGVSSLPDLSEVDRDILLGEGVDANSVDLDYIEDITLDGQNNIYLVQSDDDNDIYQIYKIDALNKITLFAGKEDSGPNDGDGGLAIDAEFDEPRSMIFDDQGNAYVADNDNRKVRRIDTSGIITTFAGTGGCCSNDGDGGPAIDAEFRSVIGLEFDDDGNLFVLGDDRIRKISVDGIISTVVGPGPSSSDDEYPQDGNMAPINFVNIDIEDPAIAVHPDGSLLFVDHMRSGRDRLRRVSLDLPGIANDEIKIPSQGGGEIYVFEQSGRHLRTLNALTLAMVIEFQYDSSGKLASITDADGNATQLQRDAEGNPTAFVSPYGLITALTLNSDGYLSAITNPDSEVNQFTYSSFGLMTGRTDPRQSVHNYGYDSSGFLTSDEDPEGGIQTLVKTGDEFNYTVNLSSHLGRVRGFTFNNQLDGTTLRVSRNPSGLESQSLAKDDGTQTTTTPDGTQTIVSSRPDPRFGMVAPLTRIETRLPSGKTSKVINTRTVTLENISDPLSLLTQTDTIEINGRKSTSVFDKGILSFTDTSTEGRKTITFIDGQGRTLKEQITGLEDMLFGYDLRGRLTTTSQGTGVDERLSTLAYNAQGFVASVIDPLNRSVQFEYDSAGRVTKQILHDLREVSFTYDDNGNVTSIVPPGRPAHVFQYNKTDLETEYNPPDIGLPEDRTLFTYDLDKQLTNITRPDGTQISFSYDLGGRLEITTLPRGTITNTYDLVTGNLVGVIAPDSEALAFTYDGSLLLSSSWLGTITGTISRVYDNDFRITSRSVNGGNTVIFTYDEDSLLSSAGPQNYTYSLNNMLLTGTTLGVTADSYSYNGFKEVINYNADVNSLSVFRNTFKRDKLGRITQKIETVQGVTHTFDYTYDTVGRVTGVDKDFGGSIDTYTYDTNGNRLNGAAVYDDQDRLTNLGANSYAYNANGELLSKTDALGTSTYNYDVLGNLLSVNVAGGSLIEYIVDARDRRIGRRVDGTLDKGWLYKDQLNPIAELDGSGNVISRFVYGSRANSPDFIIKGGSTYRIISDHLGSPRLVVNVATGMPVQMLDYDVWGNVIADTNPGFQPFGFAGGLYDASTKLTRFGARDYDPQTGRWTSKDPIGFEGGDTNLFGYVLQDPVNLLDPDGLEVGDWWDLPANFERAREIADEERQKRPRAHNDMGDAMRHAEWNRRMVEEINGFTAWVAGTGHEIEGVINGQPLEETLMDLHNNRVGRKAGASGNAVNPRDLKVLNSKGCNYY
ncbi:MAG: RHS repeat-associated protein [Nitrospinales bacterium]|jgi:RHS repeat-associated protein